MATRNTTHVLKNSDIVNRPLPGSLFKGEPIINTADGILYFSGVTTSTSEWTAAGTGTTANFFEVGSNLYDLKLRNQITKYQGTSGSGLIGKFLSGTSTGFVLADISEINGISGFTYNPSTNTFTITDASGDVYDATIQSVTGLTVNGTLSATTVNGDTVNINNLTVTGSATYNQTATSPNDIVNYSTLTSYTQTTDVYVTGSTYSGSVDSSNSTTHTLSYHATPLGGPYTLTGADTYTTGGTYDNNTTTITFKRNDGTSGYTVDLSTIDVNDTYVTGGTVTASTDSSNSGTINLLYNQDVAPGTYTLPYTDTYVTGFTYDPFNSTFTIKSNDGGSDSALIDTMTGLTVTGDAVIVGSLTVFGPSISAFTSNLYVEDSNITLNYNPTGSTTVTSIGAGWTIQDGSGISNTATTLNVGVSYLNGNLSPNTEYTSTTGNANRNLYTQLGDIIIRNTNYDSNAPDGVRVLTEGDLLDGGIY